jgi:hypothetical protein
MADTQKTFLLRCAYSDCGKETKIILAIPARRRRKKEQNIQLVRYCEYCQRPNIINVPESWDYSSPILGDDHPVLRWDNGIPVIQGEKA